MQRRKKEKQELTSNIREEWEEKYLKQAEKSGKNGRKRYGKNGEEGIRRV